MMARQTHHTMNDQTALLKALTDSDIYRDYERAFSEATGLPLALRATDTWQPTFRGKPRENGFCALMAGQNASCAACLRMQDRMNKVTTDGPAMEKCHFGLTEAAVPVKLGNSTLGLLATGQVFTQTPSEDQFEKVMRTMKRMGVKVNRAEARKTFMGTRVIPRSQLTSASRLLAIFADHLSMKLNQLAVRRSNAEPVAITRAKEYITQNLQNDMTLSDVAKAACTSTFYICKLFKRHTGMNFTEYVSRLRVEKAKELLANPNLRISEIAYEVGFQSLTHFNRIFRKLGGKAPTAYRESIAMPLAA
jgi:AraC-like DNA-binding protein/ligand-binding sensor protein